MRFILFIFLTFYLLPFQDSLASDTSDYRPKIGLALSGGGAKGLVYIPLLKAIDSLNIKIDYLTGTSMGGIIGGLYAIGYSGKQLDSLARAVDWATVLRDKLPLDKVNMEEKSEYDKYLVEFKGNTFKPSLPKGVIEGQNILNFLNGLTSDFFYLQDFSKFKIPFKCFATDLVSGASVELSEGSLPLALRTTMSIPTIFSPVEIDNMLLADGGLVKNFPVDEVKAMGADFIIGANCSSMGMNREEMTSMFKIFERMINISAADNYEEQKKLCDILMDFSESLKYLNLGSSDFSKVSEILDIGEKIVSNFIPLLVQVSEQQKLYLPELTEEYLKWGEIHSLKLDDVRTGVFDNEFKSIIKNKIEFVDSDHATNYEINRAVDRIYGTRFFDRVYYYFDRDADSVSALVYKTEGANRFNYKLGLHYDPELSAGITLNFTYRKLGKFTSRTLMSLDVSDNPKWRSGYQVYFGKSSWWFSTEQFFSFIRQISYARDGALGTYNHFFAANNVAVNWTIGQNNLISAGAQIEYFNRKSFLKKKDRTMYETLARMLVKSPYHNLNFFLLLERNTLHDKSFPVKGVHVFGFLKFVPYGGGSMTLFDRNENDEELIEEYIQTKPKFAPYTKLQVKYEQFIPLAKFLTLTYRLDGGLTLITHGLKGRTFEYPRQDAYLFGGIDQREKERFNNYIPFWGNREGFTHTFNFASVSLALQSEIIKNLFLTPRFSVLLQDETDSDAYGSDKIFINNFKVLKWVYGGGAELAYKTPLGPVKINLTRASNDREWLFYASIGYRF